MVLGVDVGGTFTDAVAVTGGRVVTAKSPTTPKDQSEGVLSAVAAVLENAGGTTDEVEAFAHGMTVATNALLEGQGATTALVATRGFTDVEELGRQARADLYRLCVAHPPPIVPPELRFAAPERTGPDGVLDALSEEDAAALAREVAGAGIEAVAVCLLHAYRQPEHEQLLGRALAEALEEDVHVSLSHEGAAPSREYERPATTTVDATLSPLLSRYLARLADRAGDEGLPAPRIMQSSGGLASLDQAARHAAWTVLSGPARGAPGAAAGARAPGFARVRCFDICRNRAAVVARATGCERVLCFDMGGPSCDVCVVEDGAVRETAGREVGDRPIALPMLDLHTVGAGGGSIGWRDPGGALRVGPRSAGAEPGPACYGRGGTEPTVTDANLLLGRLPKDGELAGGVALDVAAAEAAIGRLAEALDLPVRETAEGIIRIANAEMVRALRVMTVERGVDPREFALLAFGGAGGLHAADVADELGMTSVLCPRAGGVLAALGLVAAERRSDAQRSVLLAGDDLEADALRDHVAALAGEAREALGDADAALRVAADLRYRGQAFELTVSADEEPDPDRLRDAFHAAHEERYGYADAEGDVEVVTLRAAAVVEGPRVSLAGGDDAQVETTSRTAVLGGEEAETTVFRGEPPPGTEAEGPALFELPESTLAVPPGWRARTDDSGTLVVTKG